MSVNIHFLPLRQGEYPKGEGVDSFSDFRFHLSVCHMQLAVPNVVAIAVRMVITMLRTLPQVVLLLNVPIVVKIG